MKVEWNRGLSIIVCGFVFKTFALLLTHYDLAHRGKKK